VDRFNRIVQINLVGTFRCIAKSTAGMLALEPLADGDRGVVVNTASAAAVDGQVGQASYAASKAAVMGMTLPIARDLMDEGVRVNTILPGIFGTPLLLALPDGVKQALAASVPFPKRLGDPDEFAQAVEFLVTCGYMNAESIRVDGASAWRRADALNPRRAAHDVVNPRKPRDGAWNVRGPATGDCKSWRDVDPQLARSVIRHD
jgi:NAD(P)-dependent dehydrogenase (short-subunit alcohol dehydrogenase family)